MYRIRYLHVGLRLITALLVMFVLNGCSWGADDVERERFPYIEEALSEYSFNVTTQSEEAQNYFNQGLHLAYAFGRGDARRSFMEANKIDSTCSMCFWGEAWVRGPYLNNHRQMQSGAYEAVKKAEKLAAEGYATDVERDLIQAMTVRYNEDNSLENRDILDREYMMAMKKVYEKYPGNHDVAVLYAESLFQLEPRRGYRDIETESMKEFLGVLEKVIEENIIHPGACHYFIHAVEASQYPEKGLACAERIKETMPGGSHILHMSSHIYNQIGEWQKSIRANIEARHIDQKASLGRGFSIYPGHNLAMIAYAASMTGESSIALQAARDQARYYGDEILLPLIKFRYGRFDEILEMSEEPSGEAQRGLWFFTKGYAALKTGDESTARQFLKQVQELAGKTTDNYRVHSGSDLLTITGFILEGELLRYEGNEEGALPMFRQSVEVYDQLTYSEPETLPFSPRQWYGALLLDMMEYEKAENVYRTQLEHHPNNVWSLYGLKKSLKAQHKDHSEVEFEFNERWKRADVWIERSHF